MHWAGFVIFLISTVIFAVLASRHKKRYRVFHLLTLLITGITVLSYYALSTETGAPYIDLGPLFVHRHHAFGVRQVFWARQVDWALTSPLLLLELALLAGLPWIDVLSLLIVDEAMIVTYLLAAVQTGRPRAKWGWYAFSTLFLIYIIFSLLWHGRKSVKHQHSSVSRLYTELSIYTIVMWVFYSIIFVLGEGTWCINPNIEAILYIVVDFFSKVVFGFWLLYAHKHDSDDAHAVWLPKSWTRHRGTKGLITLPGGDN